LKQPPHCARSATAGAAVAEFLVMQSSSVPRPLDVLLPTCERPVALAATLAALAAQQWRELRLVVAEQSATCHAEDPVLRTLCALIESHGGAVEWHHRPERRGIAEQRDFLLRRASAPAVLYLDDDVVMEPWVVSALMATLARERCGFVGAFPAGLSFRDDVRPAQQAIEFWDGRVQPEAVEPGSPAWQRHQLHRAANLWHVAQRLPPGAPRTYKVAWTGACVLYDRAKLLAVGGFEFWRSLPPCHSGEEVLVQNLLMRRDGGCAIVPSGTYHAQVPSVVLNAEGRVDGHALDLLPKRLRALGLDEHGAANGAR
jgi:hypothetical protein